MTSLRKPGAGPSSRVARRDVLEAARRYYDAGETQAEIAKDLGISPSYLARLLKQAKDNGWVRVFIDTDREMELAAAIKEKYPHLRHVEVVPSGPTPEATARAIATAQAEWFNQLLDEDEASEKPKVWNVAIGGAWTHRLMVEQVVRRKNRISVGPTALTPFRGKVARWTPTTVATELALRLGALEPGQSGLAAASRTGYFYNLSVDPPTGSLSALRDWFAELRLRREYQEVAAFWDRCDVMFASAVGIDHLYQDARERLGVLGLSIEALKERGAVAVVANQFIDANGAPVPLSEHLDSLEPTFPFGRAAATPDRWCQGWRTLDLWGQLNSSIEFGAALVAANGLFADSVTAGAMTDEGGHAKT